VLPKKNRYRSADAILRATPARDPTEEEEETAKNRGKQMVKNVWSNIQSFLWPGVKEDPNFSEPLPKGSLGCPFFGSDSFISGNKKDGPGCFFKHASARVGHPRFYKFYFMGNPVVSVSGGKQYQKISALEFSHTEALSPTYNDGKGAEPEDVPNVFGNDNLNFERDKEKHALLRRLVGSGMTASEVRKSFPVIQQMAQERVQSMMAKSGKSPKVPIVMENICAEYTMDITLAQILGLQLPPDEVSVFRKKLTLWLKAMYSPIANLNIPWIIKHIPEYKARKYIEAKIRERIDYLLEHGPDASVLSNMVFAVDEEQGVTLSRKQIVENALLLTITGSETSSGTLTLMMFLL
jgi:cytochrome P450